MHRHVWGGGGDVRAHTQGQTLNTISEIIKRLFYKIDGQRQMITIVYSNSNKWN